MSTDNQVEIVVSSADACVRLDLFLSKAMPSYTRGRITKLIKSGHIKRATGATLKASHIVRENETFIFEHPEIKASTILPEDIPLEFIFSDEHIAVINKPAGMVVHTGAGVKEGTLCNALLHHFPDMVIGDQERPGIVHRLDKETSGVIIIAKTHDAHRILSDDFKYRRVKKIYRAFCWGTLRDQQFELKTGHVRHPNNRLKFTTRISVPNHSSSRVRLAHTGFSVVRQNFGIAEVQAFLYTGRTHQIRAHLSDINHPLLGDDLYGGKRAVPKSVPEGLKNAILDLSGQALFAETLELYHPITKNLHTFSAPLPKKIMAISEYLS